MMGFKDAVVTSEKSKQSEILMQLNLRTGSHEGVHEGAECDTETPKRGNEDQSVEDNSKAYRSDNYKALKAKRKELKEEIHNLTSQIKESAVSSVQLRIENNNLLKELKQICSKDEIAKLEAMNPDRNSPPLDDDDEEQHQTCSESPGEFNPSPDCHSTDEEGNSDSLTPMQMEKE